MSLLAVESLRVRFGDVAVVDGVDIALERGEALAIVGESGSGKSMTALALIDLVPPPGRVEAGRLALDGEDLRALPPAARRRLGGRAIAMVFQDPMTALNPVRSVGSLLVEAIRRHQPLDAVAARRHAIESLGAVGVPEPELRLGAFAHQLSGGLRQRVTIAMALANQPRLILADEPTTALDATIQAQILALLRDHMRDAGLILITHDLGVAAALCRRVAVMYCGRFVETGPAAALLARPAHPYTRGLVAAVPRFDARRPPLVPIPGAPLAARDRPAGCAFAARCPSADGRCRAEAPALRALATDREVACHHPEPVA